MDKCGRTSPAMDHKDDEGIGKTIVWEDAEEVDPGEKKVQG